MSMYTHHVYMYVTCSIKCKAFASPNIVGKIDRNGIPNIVFPPVNSSACLASRWRRGVCQTRTRKHGDALQCPTPPLAAGLEPGPARVPAFKLMA